MPAIVSDLPALVVPFASVCAVIYAAREFREGTHQRKADRVQRKADEERRQDDLATRMDVKITSWPIPGTGTIYRVIGITWPPLYTLRQFHLHTFQQKDSDPVSRSDIGAQRFAGGKADIAWKPLPDSHPRITEWFLVLFTDPYNTQRGLYGTTEGLLWAGRACPQLTPAEIREKFERDMGTGSAQLDPGGAFDPPRPA